MLRRTERRSPHERVAGWQVRSEYTPGVVNDKEKR